MEKFALLDFLKAFESFAPKQQTAAPDTEAKPAPPPPPPEKTEIYTTNVMANVLSRHEEISNRIKNNRR